MLIKWEEEEGGRGGGGQLMWFTKLMLEIPKKQMFLNSTSSSHFINLWISLQSGILAVKPMVLYTH